MSCTWCGKPEQEHVQGPLLGKLAPDVPCKGLLSHYLEERAPTDHPPPANEHRVHLVQLRLCEGCLAGLGSECHTPGCAMCWHDSPGFRLIPELYQVIQEESADTRLQIECGSMGGPTIADVAHAWVAESAADGDHEEPA